MRCRFRLLDADADAAAAAIAEAITDATNSCGAISVGVKNAPLEDSGVAVVAASDQVVAAAAAADTDIGVAHVGSDNVVTEGPFLISGGKSVETVPIDCATTCCCC